MLDLKAKPFYLNDEDLLWVERTLEEMNEREKIGQLFCLINFGYQENELKNIIKLYKPGGIMCRPEPLKEIKRGIGTINEFSSVPPLIAANLESGGNGAYTEGTKIGPPMQIAATDDESLAYKAGVLCGREGRMAGINWGFSPIVDIDFNFRNPITNTRTFGSDPERVKRMGVEFIKGMQAQGIAASAKHFPGDGVDERDQHLVTSINSLDCETWDRTFGDIYRACIEAGIMSIMPGHIMQPAWSRRLRPGLKDEEILPATLAPELLTDLLRNRLNFNGLIVSDASTMAGMVIPMPRSEAVPGAIAAGCDMFLFTRNLDEDYALMQEGLDRGIITPARFKEALTRILALKATLGLHRNQPRPELTEEMQREHELWAEEAADRAISLVKHRDGILPLSPQRTRRVLYHPIESKEGFAYSVRTGVTDLFREMLVGEGFSVTSFDPSKGMEGRVRPFSDVTENYDLILYLCNMATKSNQTTVRIEWEQPMGANVPIYQTMVPTIFISVENPYHLLDVPRVRNFINTYSSSDYVLKALLDKLMGRSSFKGINPVDPFCGLWDARL